MHRFLVRILVFSVAALPAVGALPAVAAESTALKVDALFEAYGARTPGCSLSVTREGKTVLSRGYGSANLEHGIPNRDSTRFYIASMAKQFTALAVALLVKDGKVALTDSIRLYVPELPAYADKITIDQIIHHTDGLRDYFTLLFFTGRGYDDAFSKKEILSLIAAQDQPNFEPGTEFLYANSGYLLLARVVEAVTGKPMGAFAKERIFDPLGMADSFYAHDFQDIIPNRAEGYVGHGTSWQSPRSRFAEIGPSGVVTTIGDLAIWLNALRNKTLGEDVTRTITSKGKLPDGDDVPYGYGLQILDYRGLAVFQHGGTRPGYYSNLAYVPQLDLGIALVCNHSPIDTVATTNKIIEIYAGDRLESLEEVPVDPGIFAKLVGEYEMSPESSLTITTDGEALFAQATGQWTVQIFPLSDFEYFYKVVDIRVLFELNNAQQVERLVLRQGGRDTKALRVEPSKFEAAPLTDFVGEYWSRELQTTYVLFVEREALLLRVNDLEPVPLAVTASDQFAALGTQFAFTRDRDGKVNGLTLDAVRVRQLSLRKM